VILRKCARCRGDMFLERLSGEENLVCLQCGNRLVVFSRRRVAEAGVKTGDQAA
jgi:DNA-directed RNA polymerase subunit RPC12/RpoP